MKTARTILAIIVLIFGIFVIYNKPFDSYTQTRCGPVQTIECNQSSKTPYSIMIGTYFIITSALIWKKPQIGMILLTIVVAVVLIFFIGYLYFEYIQKPVVIDINK